MPEDIRAEDMVEQLRTSFAERIRGVVSDLPAHQALQLADALCAVQCELLAGMRIAYRASQAVDGQAIAEAWRQGKPLAEIRREFGISKSTAYKHHPNRNAKRVRTG